MKCLTRSAQRHAPTLARRVKTQLRPHSARPYAISPPKQTCAQYASNTEPRRSHARRRNGYANNGPRRCHARRRCNICKMLCTHRPSLVGGSPDRGETLLVPTSSGAVVSVEGTGSAQSVADKLTTLCAPHVPAMSPIGPVRARCCGFVHDQSHCQLVHDRQSHPLPRLALVHHATPTYSTPRGTDPRTTLRPQGPTAPSRPPTTLIRGCCSATEPPLSARRCSSAMLVSMPATPSPHATITFNTAARTSLDGISAMLSADETRTT